MSRCYICPDKKKLSFDYDKQVWIKDGKYQDCGHPADMVCNCYGREHAGENAVITDACH